MNYTPIHTNIYPSYNYLAAENAYLRQNIEYKDAVLCEQMSTITKLQGSVLDATQTASKFEADADRWRIMKKIILTQGGQQHLYEVEKTVDKEREHDRARKEGVERRD